MSCKEKVEIRWTQNLSTSKDSSSKRRESRRISKLMSSSDLFPPFSLLESQCGPCGEASFTLHIVDGNPNSRPSSRFRSEPRPRLSSVENESSSLHARLFCCFCSTSTLAGESVLPESRESAAVPMLWDTIRSTPSTQSVPCS